jgi:hypothetical protein
LRSVARPLFVLLRAETMLTLATIFDVDTDVS